MFHARSLTAMVAAALLLWASGELMPSAEPQDGPSQVVEGAKKVGRGVEDTAKGIGKTVAERAKEAGKEAQPIGDRLHDGAKAFGTAIWDAMKSVGRTLQRVLTGSSAEGMVAKPEPAA